VTDVIGNLPVTNLAGGTGASATTFWRGDGTWASPPSGVSGVGLSAPSWLTVTGSPLTGAGTISLSGTSEPANQFLASPNGASGALAPRGIVSGDLPVASSTAYGAAKCDGATITCTSGTLSAVNNGTVTSVGVSAPSWLTVGSSPVTGAGTISLNGTSEPANQFLASPNGASGALAPRAIVSGDLPVASSTAYGAAKCDGTTVTCTSGVFSAVASNSAYTTSIYANSPTPLTIPAIGNLIEVIRQHTPAAITVQLPAAPATNMNVCVKDGGNDFAVYPATVITTDGTQIDGGAGSIGYLMTQARQFSCFIFDGTMWDVQ
jgi:hypothetical protein